MTHTQFICNDDLDYRGKWDELHDKILINVANIDEGIHELCTVINHELLHAAIGWAMSPDETTTDQDHHIIRSLAFD